MTDVPAIETRRLCKSFGRMDAVRDLSLSVEANRITGFLGRNGAGKSTTIKMLLGMIRPSSGEGFVLGNRIGNAAESVQIRRHAAYVGEDKRLYSYMTVAQIVRFTRAFYPEWRDETAAALLKKFELPADRRIKALSKGMRTKLALLLAMARHPCLLILDEPGEGLDPVCLEQVLESLIALCGEGTTIFFSSHQIEEVERIADRVCMLEQGRLLLDVSLDEVRESYRKIDLVFPFEPDVREFRVTGVESVRVKGRQMRLLSSCHTDEIVAWARDHQASEIDVEPVGLREIFLKKVEENTHALV